MARSEDDFTHRVRCNQICFYFQGKRKNYYSRVPRARRRRQAAAHAVLFVSFFFRPDRVKCVYRLLCTPQRGTHS